MIDLPARHCLALLLVAGTLAAHAQQPPATPSGASSSLRALSGINDELQALASRISPSVVKIEVSGLAEVHDQNSPATSLVGKENSVGSGIILSADGLILTNAHVVEHATSVHVTIYDHPNDRRSRPEDVHRLQAEVLGRDELTDIALLKVDAKALPALELADSDQVRVGQLAMAFGSPLGLENTFTLGVISSTQRQLNINSPVIYLQTDASINPGNSGGPLIDIHGHVIGMNTLIASQSGGSEGVGFSIPAKTLAFVYNQLRTTGHVRRGALGIAVSAISPELSAGLGLPNKPGIILEDVLPGSSADKAGLHPGDVVTAVDGKPIADPQQLSVVLFGKQVGDITTFDIRRPDGTLASIKVNVTGRPRDPADIFDPSRLQANIITRLGIIVVPLSADIAPLIPPTRFPQGLLVAAVAAGSKSAALDIQTGDVLYSLNRQPLHTLDDLRSQLEHLPADAPIALQLERDGKLEYIAFTNPD